MEQTITCTICKVCRRTADILSDIIQCKECKTPFHISCPLATEKVNHSNRSSTWTCSKCSDVRDKICSSCEKPVENPSFNLKCQKCLKVYHIACAGIERLEFQKMKTEKQKQWKCQPCILEDTMCGSCEKPVESPSVNLKCKDCQKLYHISCVGIQWLKFAEMTAKQKNQWNCKQCSLECLKKYGKAIGKHVAISAGLTAVCLGGIPLVAAGLGFGAAGVTAGSLAALYQSAVLGGHIAAGSAFAVGQSIGAAGLAASTQVGIAAVSSTVPFLGKLMKKKPKE